MDKLVYDTKDCMKRIKKKYPFIPMCIIRRVLHGEEVYMHEVGIINWVPNLSDWHFSNKEES